MTKPRIFIGSSREQLVTAHAVNQYLNNTYAFTTLWDNSVPPGDYVLPALYKVFNDYDYGIFIFSKDDILNIRGEAFKTTRDNVLFEFGMFLGVNGLNNAFILCPDDYSSSGGRIPSDLFGLTLATFDSKRPKNELIDAVSSSCQTILSKIQEEIEQKKSESNALISGDRTYDIITYEGELLARIVEILSSAQKKVVFVLTKDERHFLFDTIISVLYARIRGVEIQVHYYPITENYKTSYSIELFRQLGCNVKEYEEGIEPENVIYLGDPELNDFSRLIIKQQRYSRKNILGYFYKGVSHSHIIHSIYEKIEDIKEIDAYTPKIVEIGEGKLAEIMNEVPLYLQNNCKFSMEKVLVSETYPLSTNLIREHKINQIDLLNKLYSKFDFELYQLTAIVLKNGEQHLIVPPVLEVHDNKYIIAEGHTRLFLQQSNNEGVWCIVIRGMKTAPISPTTTWSKVEIAPMGAIRNFKPNQDYMSRLRKIEKYLHKGHWYEEIKKFK
ncbi:TIR domain-containing protein [Kriegella aquimaris]|uniref:Predicted nucleotide-binding protein containing TIR-like domain-containing protein n=1 Tax=Kriegella aquimaris TaxID=192904 RepID=A0A1G9I6Z4_9FLAO|nr:TIR domain-containing protein [Kriegella aquimaris]SDL21001.1 Predicted nucleotide-binding protein containing TIR-like domain-containing protein [Kriegella aquimaris]